MKNETVILKGLVIQSSRNIINIRVDTPNGQIEYECRIKGKVLKDQENLYNPIAPGDWVIAECQNDSNNAMVISVEERKNLFSRYNQKGNASQLLAANIDYVLCLCTPVSPPFRPRFLDRVLLQADIAKVEAIVICNKIDLECNDLDVEERLEEYNNIGYKVLRVSAKTGEGIDELRSIITGKTSVLIGQSGVGKSSLLNTLQPGLDIKEGHLNEKYDRGNHTTTLSILYEITNLSKDLNKKTYIIDTPGVRRFFPDGIKSNEVVNYMNEFAPLAGKCSFGLSCSHKTERGCKIMEAVHAGIIHEDRYESFLRIYDDLKGKEADEY
ncbi:MAG: ribosome small subunit-dependent GTPase A [Treponema sp.]|nr:ribosome small subunit-dependent GTPase A [Treponema sp.]